MTKRVQDMASAELDFCVARAAGLNPKVCRKVGEPGFRWIGDAFPHGTAANWLPDWKNYHPSTDWAHGGPIIERERIAVIPASDCYKWAAAHIDSDGSRVLQFADTPLEAAMRCFVASKFGDEVPNAD